MSLLSVLLSFISNGFVVFTQASSKKYDHRSEAVKKMREEILCRESSSFLDDKRHMHEDRKAVSNDVKTTFDKLSLSNG